MKKLITVICIALTVALSGCAALGGGGTTTQQAQVSYVQSCVAYASAFNLAVQARQAGKLNTAQIAQVNLIDSQITPICSSGVLPADPATATAQITTAVTTLGLLEAVRP